MNIKTNSNRKICLFSHTSIQSKFQFVWKILLVFILSTLLSVPAPALALNYSETVQSYISNVKSELDGIQKSIAELPNLSYEHGQKALPDIENKLQQLKTEASDRAQEFQQLSEREQTEYNKLLDRINQLYTAQKNQQQYVASYPSSYQKSCFRISLQGNVLSATCLTRNQSSYDTSIRLKGIENIDGNLVVINPQKDAEFYLTCRNIDVFRDEIEGDCQTNNGDFISTSTTIKGIENINGELKYTSSPGSKYEFEQAISSLESKKQNLTEGITSASQTSLVFNKLEQKINSAKNRAGKLREFMSEFNSFNEPDLLNEKNALYDSIAQAIKAVDLLTSARQG
ncbi:Cyanovirin-N [Nostoc carneum NIES-2107]|nr:Cyanovirin-N [Nostoc carneum NIES-2107]